MDPEDKNTITKLIYKNNIQEITFFSAPWCKFCNKIKPEFEKYIKSNNYNEPIIEYISKEEYKSVPEQKFIPAFIIKNDINSKYIQTSNITELLDIINSSNTNTNFNLTEDF